eukprot:CAMPEP_0115506722 /NCGR_PEP_ID=MMETSP0271-20121206/71320_1 /TAXON_ID=71861 /ORGANISM="Scrippsiella trochoidea, Strain CCMP3099" /LENGTH=135 /DNA_ID=CAMNT_0002936217 /DNA_START=33 /DNA_END=441 /DNA_ORIENTATION=-
MEHLLAIDDYPRGASHIHAGHALVVEGASLEADLDDFVLGERELDLDDGAAFDGLQLKMFLAYIIEIGRPVNLGIHGVPLVARVVAGLMEGANHIWVVHSGVHTFLAEAARHGSAVLDLLISSAHKALDRLGGDS